MKYYCQIARYILILQILIIPQVFASFQWDREQLDLELHKKIVNYLNELVVEAGEDAIHKVNSNIAVATISVNMKDVEENDVRLEIELPYFFLSGWRKHDYNTKINKDIVRFIHDHTYSSQEFQHYSSYKVCMLEDFYNKINDYKAHLQNAFNLNLEGMTEAEFNQKYLHSEQAIFLLCEEELPKIQKKLALSLGSFPEILNYEINILSYRPVCRTCKETAKELIEGISLNLPNIKPFIFNFSSILSASNTSKRKSLENDEKEARGASSSKKRKDNWSAEITQDQIKWDNEKERKLQSILNPLSYKKSNSGFLKYLQEITRDYRITNVITLLSEDKCDLQEVRKQIGILTSDLGGFVDTKLKISACEILYAYTYIFMDKDRNHPKHKIIQNMFKIIEELKRLQEECFMNIRNSSSEHPMLFGMRMKEVPPEFYILSKVAEKFIIILEPDSQKIQDLLSLKDKGSITRRVNRQGY